jgi:DNA-directed RNA polymerase subunit RPC12/RpoP
MKTETSCPACNCERLVPGRYFNPRAFHDCQRRPPAFRADGIKQFTIQDPSVLVLNRKFTACLECGVLWARLNPSALELSLSKYGALPGVKDLTEADHSVLACVACESRRLVLGRTNTRTPAFRPKGLRLFCFMTSELSPVKGNRFAACSDCGLMWSGIEKTSLSLLLSRKGTSHTKGMLKLTTKSPLSS